MTASTKPEIVQTGPLMAYAADQLKARFTVHELWKAADRAALLRMIGNEFAVEDPRLIRQAEKRAYWLGRFLGHQKIPRQTLFA